MMVTLAGGGAGVQSLRRVPLCDPMDCSTLRWVKGLKMKRRRHKGFRET